MKILQGHFLWALGGKHEFASAVKEVSVYDIDRNLWITSKNGQLAPMPHAVQGAGWTLFDQKIYCFGGKTGFHSGCSNYVQVYDIARNQWDVLDPMPAARSKLAKNYPVVNQHYVYLFGGDSSRGHHNRVNWNWKFDLTNHQWDLDTADAPLTQSFPVATHYQGWLYYSTGNTGLSALHRYPGAPNQRYHPGKDKWEVLTPGPIPTTDGEGDMWRGELHYLGGWNANPNFYNFARRRRFRGPVKRQHLIYNYEKDQWRIGSSLPGHWHHGGAKAAVGYLWRYLGTIDEDASIRTKILAATGLPLTRDHRIHQHSNRIFCWKGEKWREKKSAPIRKINFGCVYSRLGPVGN